MKSVLRQRKKKIAPSGGDVSPSLRESLLDRTESGSDFEEDEASAKRCQGTVFQQTLSYITYLVEKVAVYLNTYLGSSKKLSELQKKRLFDLVSRIGVKYEQDKHGAFLKKLWTLAFPDLPFVEGSTKQWQEMGWQGNHPSSDFRGGGFLALENLVYFAECKPLAFQRLCFKMQGVRSDWEYPFAAAGVNITFMLTKCLDLHEVDRADKDICSTPMLLPPPSTTAGKMFLKLLDVESKRADHAFEEIFCETFELLDKIWLEEKADYMQFPAVMKKVEEKLPALLKQYTDSII
mmetsp:Transcript_14562/g.41483  ORF Transcript_14562/g.41483 Transcript_14562/m.41483 type:complete len:292 (+) Transcript_14562:129-1004(+)